MKNTTSTKVKAAGWGLILLTLLALSEGLSYALTAYLATKGAVYVPQTLDGYETYIKTRDPVMGWSPRPGDGGTDLSGSRKIPAAAEVTRNCISIYGDSFVYGSGIKAADTISNQLTKLLECRVGNFGVTGYGSDQSFMRYRNNRKDQAETVILGHLSENILRNVNRYRWLLYPGATFQFKPRFILDEDGELEFLPMPEFDRDGAARIFDDPAKNLTYDSHVPGGHGGSLARSFPYTLTVLRSLWQFQVQAKLMRQPWYTVFYEPDHPARGVAVTTEIFSAFLNEADTRKQHALIVILPTGLDMTYFLRTGKWPYETLVQELKRRGMPYIDVGAEMIAHLENQDICDYFQDCTHHYTSKGAALTAKILYRQLKGRIN